MRVKQCNWGWSEANLLEVLLVTSIVLMMSLSIRTLIGRSSGGPDSDTAAVAAAEEGPACASGLVPCTGAEAAFCATSGECNAVGLLGTCQADRSAVKICWDELACGGVARGVAGGQVRGAAIRFVLTDGRYTIVEWRGSTGGLLQDARCLDFGAAEILPRVMDTLGFLVLGCEGGCLGLNLSCGASCRLRAAVGSGIGREAISWLVVATGLGAVKQLEVAWLGAGSSFAGAAAAHRSKRQQPVAVTASSSLRSSAQECCTGDGLSSGLCSRLCEVFR